MNRLQPGVTGVSGGVPVSANRSYVSIQATDRHVITATSVVPGACSYGLWIASAADPVMAQDHLTRAGIYAAVSATSNGCSASSAPAAGAPEGNPETRRGLVSAGSGNR